MTNLEKLTPAQQKHLEGLRRKQLEQQAAAQSMKEGNIRIVFNGSKPKKQS